MHTTVKNSTVFIHNGDLSGNVIITQKREDNCLTEHSVNIPVADLIAFVNDKHVTSTMHQESEPKPTPIPRKLTEREIQFIATSNKIRSQIDFSKNGSVAASLLQFIHEMGPVTFKEINMFYKRKTPSNYNSTRDRGGSLTKWLAYLQYPSKRAYDNSHAYIVKKGTKNPTYEVIDYVTK